MAKNVFRIPARNLAPSFRQAGVSGLWLPLGTQIDRNFAELERVLDLPAAHVFGSVEQTNLTNNTFVKVDYDTEVYDIGSNFNRAGNVDQFECPKDGIVLVCACVIFEGNADSGAGDRYALALFKNGTEYKRLDGGVFVAINTDAECSGAVDAEVKSGDNLDIRAIQVSGADTVDLFGDANGAFRWATFRYAPILHHP